MKQVLIIEDEKDIIELLEFNLRKNGFEVKYAQSGEDGLRLARTSPPDIILLDLMLPGINGLDICKLLKTDQKTGHIPVIMLTAKDEEVDVVTGLEVGADDYITKPFSPKVLIARLRALLRRNTEKGETVKKVLKAGPITIDPGKHSVEIDNQQIQLTATEFQLLLVLAKRPGWVFNRTQLVDDIRGEDHIITDRAIDVQIANLRKKLGDAGEFIQTVRGAGYRFRENE
ncbi:MAG: DNA-binding response regulator [Calditrichaeota bacterium]|nr:MAG: DNA-binding response regulator [Calditrichota bacterium]